MAGIGDYIKGKSFSEMFKKKSPLSFLGMGKSARQKRARKYKLEDRETRRLAHENASLTGGTGEGN
jgi:hypothetical protein